VNTTRRSEAEPSKGVCRTARKGLLEVRSKTWSSVLSAAIAIAAGYWSYAAYVPRIEPDTQYLTTGTTYTVPTTCINLMLRICAGGGGGGGQLTGAATACTAASGSGGACAEVEIKNPSGTLTYALGAAGAAGTNDPTTPVAGGNGGDSTITINGVLLTEHHGIGGGTNNGACTSAPSAPAGGTSVAGNLGSGISIRINETGTNGIAGSATTTQAVGGSAGNAGGNAGNVNASGVAQHAPSAGEPGYLRTVCDD